MATTDSTAYLAPLAPTLTSVLAKISRDMPADPIAAISDSLLAAGLSSDIAFRGAAGEGTNGAVIGGRPKPPSGLDNERAMELAVGTPAEPQADRPACDILLFISSAAGYERRRKTIRATYLQVLKSHPEIAKRVRYKFLLGAPKPDQVAELEAEQAEQGDLLQVAVPESYETLFPKVVAAWRWAVSTHDFQFWMHADDDAYIRLDSLLKWLDDAPDAQPWSGLYAGYIWDGSEGRRTKPLRDPTAKSYMPYDQWPHESYPPFASGCGFLLSRDLIEGLVEQSPTFTFFRVIDVPVGVFVDRLPPKLKEALRIVHVDEIRPYRPLPLFRKETIVQHYMQPEEFKQFHQRALAAMEEEEKGGEADKVKDEAEQRMAAVYDLFVQAKVMRR